MYWNSEVYGGKCWNRKRVRVKHRMGNEDTNLVPSSVRVRSFMFYELLNLKPLFLQTEHATVRISTNIRAAKTAGTKKTIRVTNLWIRDKVVENIIWAICKLLWYIDIYITHSACCVFVHDRKCTGLYKYSRPGDRRQISVSYVLGGVPSKCPERCRRRHWHNCQVVTSGLRTQTQHLDCNTVPACCTSDNRSNQLHVKCMSINGATSMLHWYTV